MGERINIHIDITSQDTTARIRYDTDGSRGYFHTVLYDIQDLKPFNGFSLVRFNGKEEFFFCNQRMKMLVGKDIAHIDDLLAESRKGSVRSAMTHKVNVTKTEERTLEEYWTVSAAINSVTLADGLCTVREYGAEPTPEEIAQFLYETGAECAKVEHNYRFALEG